MNVIEPRIQPVDTRLEEPLKSKMAKIFPSDMPAPALYRTIARNEPLFIEMIDAKLIGPTGLLDRKTFPPKVRELLILRTCALTRNEYEFNLHVQTISEAMGLSKEQIDDLKSETVSEHMWSESEISLIHLVDGLVKNIEVKQVVFENALKHFDEPELIELTLLVGQYTSVAMVVALAKPKLDKYR
jgi:alkylhydroperoxidase family enzyme